MDEQWQMPLAWANKDALQSQQPELTILAADVGGTKTNLALFRLKGEGLMMEKEKSFHSATFPSFIDIIKAYLSEYNLPSLDRICAGVAGPIVKGVAEITNLSWELDVRSISREIGVQRVKLLNDLEATAFGLAGLTAKDLVLLHAGDASVQGNAAILAPGTGLGEAGLYWDGAAYHPFPTEGGHCDFCPRTDFDIELYGFLHQKYGVVSWEKVVAGPGIHDIYSFLRALRQSPEPSWLTTALVAQDPSAVISHAAVNSQDAVCMEAMQHFVRYLARECSNLVLKMKATGGLFLGGGIPPKIAPLLETELFYQHYLDCDRMQNLLSQAPIYIIANDQTALLGAGWFGAYGDI